MRLPAAKLAVALALLSACAPLREPAILDDAVQAEASAGLAGTRPCQPGEDDGIGGTGCQID